MRRTSIVCLAALALACAAQSQRPAKTAPVPAVLKKAVSCLVSAGYVREFSLKPLGLKEGDWAWVRYYVGSVPGMDPTPNEYYVAVYARGGRRGELLEALPNSRRGFEAVRNGYRLWRTGDRWSADEGQGGYVDYQAFGRLATRLAAQPRYWVHLVPGGQECAPQPE